MVMYVVMWVWILVDIVLKVIIPVSPNHDVRG